MFYDKRLGIPWYSIGSFSSSIALVMRSVFSATGHSVAKKKTEPLATKHNYHDAASTYKIEIQAIENAHLLVVSLKRTDRCSLPFHSTQL